MGDPVKLSCSICGEEYYIHPAGWRPVENAELCPTCSAFKDGMQAWKEEEAKLKNLNTLGMLIVGLSAFCIVTLGLWVIFH